MEHHSVLSQKTKAKAQHSKGTKVELSVTKVGGNNEKITSNRYKLSLFDKQGQEVQVDVYGIDKITSDIQSVDMDGIIPLFNNISKEDILRPSGTVDMQAITPRMNRAQDILYY